MTLRKIVKAITPPILLDLVRGASKPHEPEQSPSMYRGNYASFEEAAKNAVGYDDPNAGGAAANRLTEQLSRPNPVEIDGRFQQVHSALCIAREKLNRGRMSVLDFGGGNGGYYFRLKGYFPEACLDWTVVETASMVEACAPVAAHHVSFATEIPAGKKYDVAIVSGTLQYLPDAYTWLDRILDAARWVILTRLPVIDSPEDRFMVQIVPAHIHTGSMPVMMFGEAKIRAAIEARGTIEQSWLVALDEGSLAYVPAKPVGYLIQTSEQVAG